MPSIVKFAKRFFGRSVSAKVDRSIRLLCIESLETRRVFSTTPIIIDNSQSSPAHNRFGVWATNTGIGYGNSIAHT